MKLLVDTNVLIDYYLRRPEFISDVRRLFLMRMFGDSELWVSAKSFTDVSYVGGKALGSSNIQRIVESSLRYLNVCSLDCDDVRYALEQRWPDFEDCLIDRAAQKVGANYIITRDARGFGRSVVPAIAPARLIEIMEKDHGLVYEELSC